ncbi:MAG: hypothetical protein GY950_35220 [bacterium]|nr:hypothetical protein [bacterium]
MNALNLKISKCNLTPFPLTPFPSLKEILLVFFVEAIDRETREKYEARYRDESSGVTVVPVFVATGN